MNYEEKRTLMETQRRVDRLYSALDAIRVQIESINEELRRRRGGRPRKEGNGQASAL